MEMNAEAKLLEIKSAEEAGFRHLPLLGRGY